MKVLRNFIVLYKHIILEINVFAGFSSYTKEHSANIYLVPVSSLVKSSLEVAV